MNKKLKIVIISTVNIVYMLALFVSTVLISKVKEVENFSPMNIGTLILTIILAIIPFVLTLLSLEMDNIRVKNRLLVHSIFIVIITLILAPLKLVLGYSDVAAYVIAAIVYFIGYYALGAVYLADRKRNVRCGSYRLFYPLLIFPFMQGIVQKRMKDVIIVKDGLTMFLSKEHFLSPDTFVNNNYLIRISADNISPDFANTITIKMCEKLNFVGATLSNSGDFHAYILLKKFGLAEKTKQKARLLFSGEKNPPIEHTEQCFGTISQAVIGKYIAEFLPHATLFSQSQPTFKKLNLFNAFYLNSLMPAKSKDGKMFNFINLMIVAEFQQGIKQPDFDAIKSIFIKYGFFGVEHLTGKNTEAIRAQTFLSPSSKDTGDAVKYMAAINMISARSSKMKEESLKVAEDILSSIDIGSFSVTPFDVEERLSLQEIFQNTGRAQAVYDDAARSLQGDNLPFSANSFTDKYISLFNEIKGFKGFICLDYAKI